MPDEALEFLRKLREEAWEEGFRAGFSQASTGKQKKNPYRKKDKEK
jgi:hypothetical protein